MLTLTPPPIRRRSRHGERGQTFVEAVVFFPLLIAMMFALIFFSRLGVLSERSQSAVRYGNMVSMRNGSAYTVSTIESVIDEVIHINSNELGPLCLEPSSSSFTTAQPIFTVPPQITGVLGTTGDVLPVYTPQPQNTSVANRVATDTQAALVQAQVVSGATAVPSAKPYWRPDNVSTSQCNPASVALQSGTYSVGNMPISVQSVSISSSLTVPTYLQAMMLNGETSAQMGFLNVATPNILLACVPGVNVVLTILQPDTAGKAGPACPGAPPGG